MRKQTFTDRKTREQGKAGASPLPKADESRRMFNNIVGFWRVCERPGCRRNRACLGDMHACFERLWPLVPEEEKEYLRGCIKAAQNTRSRGAIHKAGIAARDACLRDTARLAAPAAAPQAEPARASAPAPEVRLRRL